MNHKTRGVIAGIALATAMLGADGAKTAAGQTSREVQCASAGDALSGVYATLTAKYGARFENSDLTAAEKDQLNRALAGVVRAC